MSDMDSPSLSGSAWVDALNGADVSWDDDSLFADLGTLVANRRRPVPEGVAGYGWVDRFLTEVDPERVPLPVLVAWFDQIWFTRLSHMLEKME